MNRRGFIAALLAAPVAVKAAPLLASSPTVACGPLAVQTLEAASPTYWYPIPDAPGLWMSDVSGEIAHLGGEAWWQP